MKSIKNILSICISQGILHSIKFSFIIGSQYAFFSGINWFLPIVGLVSGGVNFTISIAAHIIYAFFFSKKILFTSLFGILTIIRLPTIIAGYYAIHQSRLIQILIPAFCITLFLFHNEGANAPLYTIYWFVPLVTTFIPKNNLIIRLVNITLIQHAIGSVIFLYRTNMASSYWNTLIPVVGIERLLFALGMFIVIQTIVQLNKRLSKIKLQKNSVEKNRTEKTLLKVL